MQQHLGNLSNVLLQSIGSESGDKDVLVRKMTQINNALKDSVTATKMFSLTSLDLSKYVSAFCESATVKESHNLNEYSQESLMELFKKYQDNFCIRSLIVSARNMKHFRFSTETNARAFEAFVKREPGIELCPLPYLPTLNLKQLYLLGKEKAFDALEQYLKEIKRIGETIHAAIVAPNIDIKKFSKIIVSELTKLKKNMPQCRKAFDLIEQSVGLLETNFDQYYRDSIESKNNSIIIENFISDIMQQQSANSELASQFRKIIDFISNKLGHRHKDQAFKMLFDLLKTNDHEIAKIESARVKVIDKQQLTLAIRENLKL